MENTDWSFLGLVRRANALISGAKLMEKLASKEVYLVLLNPAASERTKKHIRNRCLYYQIPLREDIDEASIQSISDQFVAAVGITHQQMAKRLMK